jgi:hypothetical protein
VLGEVPLRLPGIVAGGRRTYNLFRDVPTRRSQMNHVESGQKSVWDYPPRLEGTGKRVEVLFEDMTIQPSASADGPLADSL